MSGRIKIITTARGQQSANRINQSRMARIVFIDELIFRTQLFKYDTNLKMIDFRLLSRYLELNHNRFEHLHFQN